MANKYEMEKTTGGAISKRPRVTLIGHCYRAAENQKNLMYLARDVDLQAIVPKWITVENGKKMYGRACISNPSIIEWQKPFYVFGQLMLWPFGRLLAKHKPDIVHVDYESWSPLTIETVLLAGHFCPKAKLVLTVKKNTYLPKFFLLEQVKTFIRKKIDKSVSAYIASSEMAKNLHQAWLGEDSCKFRTCHHLGVDLDVFAPVSSANKSSTTEAVVGYCGALHLRKGVPELVEAVRRLVSQTNLSVKLRLLGKFGFLRSELEQEAKNSPWLSVEGPVPHRDVALFLQGCDVFAFPSRNEPDHQEHDAHGLMEAMAAGLPSVTTKSGIIPEIANKTCSFFVSENSPSKLAESIAKLTKSPQLRLQMGRHARSLAEQHFGLDTVASRKVRIYKDVINA